MKGLLLLLVAVVISAVLVNSGVAFITWGGSVATLTNDQRGAVTFGFVFITIVVWWILMCELDDK